MDNPRSLRLWDCATCSDNAEEMEVSLPTLDKVRKPSGIVPLPFGIGRMSGTAFDSAGFDHVNNPMRTPMASGAATPANPESAKWTSSYHFQNSSTQDRGRYDYQVQLRTRVESAYGELEDMPPLSPDQLRSPAVPRFQEPLVYEPPRSAQKPSNLYKDAPSSASQKLLDATQSIAHTVVETLSPRKSRDVDPLVRAPAPKSTKDVLLGLIPSSLTSIWSSEQDDGDEQPRGVEVTTALQYGAPPSSAPTATARKGPISYGGAYSMSPYQLARPTHVTVSDFPSPSHTPYNPAVRSRR